MNTCGGKEKKKRKQDWAQEDTEPCDRRAAPGARWTRVVGSTVNPPMARCSLLALPSHPGTGSEGLEGVVVAKWFGSQQSFTCPEDCSFESWHTALPSLPGRR